MGNTAADAAEATWFMPDFGSLDDFGVALFIVVAVVAVTVIVIPLLLFGIELIILGLVVAAGIVGRALLGRPWVVQAMPVGDPAGASVWRVIGWRRSARLIDEVAASLGAGLDPSPGEAAERMGRLAS
jgi:hypothetical protein